MYESFFGLEARPFLASPIAERYYPAVSIEQARETVARCIERAEGPAVILGSAGTGKSTLCQVLAHQMREKFRVATLASARLCTRRALLQNILFELKQPYRDREEGELRLSLIDFLEPSDTCPHGMLLLVDEAHVLPLRLLEEIRMLTNLVRDGQPRVRLVLAASLLLDERLASPRLESFNQRIAARCYLQSMNRDETAGYIRAQVTAVGGEPERVFTDDALQAVYSATDGIPRLVNQVCDHVLVMAAIGRHAPVDAAGVEEAWADLQQLPSSWASREEVTESSSESPAEDAGILEFGELDEPESREAELDVVPAATPDPVVEPLEPQVSAHLDEVESGISALSREAGLPEMQPADEEGDDQFHPACEKEPEIELVFHQAHDPFSESFADEEVIVDPLSSLETLGGVPQSQPVSDDMNSAVRLARSGKRAEEVVPAHDLAALDDMFPDPMAGSDAEADGIDSRGSLPGDDRDLLEVSDDTVDPSREYTLTFGDQPPRRRAYRQLFANLRRR